MVTLDLNWVGTWSKIRLQRIDGVAIGGNSYMKRKTFESKLYIGDY